MALQQTDHFRKDIYSALEDLPFILSDHVAMVKLSLVDEELHRRTAALYASLFKLMEVIFAWFLKNSLGKIVLCRTMYINNIIFDLNSILGIRSGFLCLYANSPHGAATGARFFVNPSKFSETLKNKLADVKLSAQRISIYTNLIATKRQQNIEQQTYSLIYMQGESLHVQNQSSQKILDGIDELKKSHAMHAMILEQMSSFLGTHMDSGTYINLRRR